MVYNLRSKIQYRSSIHNVRKLLEEKHENLGTKGVDKAFYENEDPCQSMSIQHDYQSSGFEGHIEMKENTAIKKKGITEGHNLSEIARNRR
ncbi:hypothetical protein LR48_Vigan05g072500 [Vigna angularis]|uniref:Uncharacterized protein n=1 Tax=Phaseolus angularis TaxID=3914 RepID=A0A0L9UKA6_PHAAN|nr:hypothetical protein LR48_Vigan05g072500 [Vigna angularis]